MNPALIALELRAIVEHKSKWLTPTEIDALTHAIVYYRHLAKTRETRST